MSDELKKFLEDSKSFPDTTPVRIGETEVPLGSLRSLNSGERNQLAERMRAVEETEKRNQEKGQKVVELARLAQSAYEAAEEARKSASSSTPASGAADWKNDPWYQPLTKEFEARDKELNSLKDQLKQALESVKSVATIGLEDRWDREYGSIDFGKREKKPSRDELLDFATKQNLTDRHKIPSVRAAWEKMSEQDRMSDEKEKARLEGIEEGRRQAMAARVPPPGVSGPGAAGFTPPSGKAPMGELGDIYSEAIKDPELRALLEQAQSNGVM